MKRLFEFLNPTKWTVVTWVAVCSWLAFSASANLSTAGDRQHGYAPSESYVVVGGFPFVHTTFSFGPNGAQATRQTSLPYATLCLFLTAVAILGVIYLGQTWGKRLSLKQMFVLVAVWAVFSVVARTVFSFNLASAVEILFASMFFAPAAVTILIATWQMVKQIFTARFASGDVVPHKTFAGDSSEITTR